MKLQKGSFRITVAISMRGWLETFFRKTFLVTEVRYYHLSEILVG
jgi:hypothetical protein